MKYKKIMQQIIDTVSVDIDISIKYHILIRMKFNTTCIMTGTCIIVIEVQF